SASQPSPISLTSVLGSELSGLNSPVVSAIPSVAVTPTKTNQTKDEVAPISGATVADFGAPVYLVNSAIPSTQARLKAAIVSTAVPIGIASSGDGRHATISARECCWNTMTVTITPSKTTTTKPMRSAILTDSRPTDTASKLSAVMMTIPIIIVTAPPGSP